MTEEEISLRREENWLNRLAWILLELKKRFNSLINDSLESIPARLDERPEWNKFSVGIDRKILKLNRTYGRGGWS